MSKIFNPLYHPACLAFPAWLRETAWAEHTPFAMFLISVVRPDSLVELGTWRGVSYSAFCQAVKELNLPTRCFAVDTWRGDEHAGKLGDEALRELREHHETNYKDFSRLIQSTFDDAAKELADGSIDILHIDGFHSYEAVRGDYETWLPKMSGRGIMLFHDTNVRERGFGVYRFWEEISAGHPNFEFLHGHGLGVLAVGKETPEDLKFLFEADETQKNILREFFYALGSRVEFARRLQEKETIAAAQDDYIEQLKTYERVVNESKVLRGYRVWRDEGVGSLLRKSIKKK